MKIDFDVCLRGFKNEPIMVGDKNVTLKDVCVKALVGPADEKSISGDEKYIRFTLAQKISSGGVLDLKVEEVAKIKELIGKNFGVILVGASYNLLDKGI